MNYDSTLLRVYGESKHHHICVSDHLLRALQFLFIIYAFIQDIQGNERDCKCLYLKQVSTELSLFTSCNLSLFLNQFILVILSD